MGDAFLLNRYLMQRQFECKRAGDNTTASTVNCQAQAAYDLNANEYFHPNAELIYGSRRYSVKGDCKAQIYYDMPLYLSSFEGENTPVSLPQTDLSPVSFTRKSDIDSPSRSSHAKLPNCLRRKQLAIYKSKYVESQLDAKLTAVYKTGNFNEAFQPNLETDCSSFLPQNELFTGQSQCSYRPNIICNYSKMFAVLILMTDFVYSRSKLSL